MDTSNKTGQCCICLIHTTGLNFHHTIPRSLGGEHSKQIPLCGTCHEILHKKADAYKSCIVKGNPVPTKNFWSNPKDEQRAEYWFRVLLQALLNPPVAQEDKATLLPMIKVDPTTRGSLDVLKQDKGLQNLDQVLKYCITITLEMAGLQHGLKSNSRQHASSNKRILKKGANSKSPKLW